MRTFCQVTYYDRIWRSDSLIRKRTGKLEHHPEFCPIAAINGLAIPYARGDH
jgi:hypothetical protein